MVKNKMMLTAIGTLLVIFGVIWSIPFSIKGGNYSYLLILTTLSVIAGVLLIVKVYGDENE